MSLTWPWHFVSVSPAEKQHRRELLDLRGYYAQGSVLLVIVLTRLYKVYSESTKSADRPNNRRSRRPKSWLDSPPLAGWVETRRQYIFSLIWLGWLLSLSVWNTGDDYLHLTKALGHVGLSQLPFQVLMSPSLYIITSKSGSPSILSVLISIPQPALTPYHRLLGRLVLPPLLVGHATLYLSFFVQSSHPDFSSLFAKRIQDLDVQWGISAVSIAILLLLFARPLSASRGVWSWTTASVKTKRQVFYITHIFLVATLCLAAYFHVVHARVFVLEALVGFAINVACCWMKGR
ncbi:putative metalloreductase Fre8 [Aspergillus tanneri]|uniref:Ferric oxidoreductase domain-containing protein n=1 Tax=Aspergillus tanneri TaxID=1220188 RepID=A0A5M9MQ08_9EURO|nr:uncharacterized protein ATNIH1004_008893 [Aspergillus tanneri]KAA8644687.1 hypothetical protein ATNIH1004_008893 [Aspergillus tanneri]